MAQSKEPWEQYAPQGIAPDKNHKCALHGVHVPEPLILEGHHVIPKGMQKQTGVILPGYGEVLWVCPTGHANIHQRLSGLLRGKTFLGRGGKTHRLAMRAFYWYKDNSDGPPRKVSELIEDDEPSLSD